jgi:hypothetical protein
LTGDEVSLAFVMTAFSETARRCAAPSDQRGPTTAILAVPSVPSVPSVGDTRPVPENRPRTSLSS